MLKEDLLHGFEQGLSVVLEGHNQLQLGAPGLHGCRGTEMWMSAGT